MFLRLRQRFEQSGTAGGGIAFRPGLEPARGQCRGVESVAAEKQGFAADDVAGDGEAGETMFACLSGVIEADDPVGDPPGLAGAAGGIKRLAGIEVAGRPRYRRRGAATHLRGAVNRKKCLKSGVHVRFL